MPSGPICRLTARAVLKYQAWRRKTIRRSATPRPSSYPFISGDTLRALSNHVYEDSNAALDPAAILEGDVVFVQTDLARRFLEETQPHVRARYVLVTHNSDDSVTADLAALAGDRIIAWYAQNLTVRHPKLEAIPIGLENLYYYTNGIVADFVRLRRRRPARKSRILHSATTATNPEARGALDSAVRGHPLVDRVAGLHSYCYRRVVRSYRFLASPPGNGIDCHRTWEALYLGTVPILAASQFSESFRDHPVWIVEKWDELRVLTERDLDRKYEEIMNRSFDEGRLFMDSLWPRICGTNV